MKKFQIFRYLKQLMPLIILFFLAMTVVSYKMLGSKQSYTASAVIRYAVQETTEENASGAYLAPDGTEIDVSEINSSANMARVMSNLGLSYSSYSLDALCASITVEQVKTVTAAEGQTDQENKKPVQTPPVYIVSCTLGSSASAGLVRDILNELLDVYFSDFSIQHINLGQISNQTKGLADSSYDYLEMIEIIDSQCTDTVKTLSDRYSRAYEFRSSITGYSFYDMQQQFKLIRDIEVPKLYALVLGNQITKDKELLINKYQNRVSDYELTGKKAQEDITDALNVIQAYVEKMRESGNTDLDADYILNGVYEHRTTSGNLVDRTVEYDELLRNWVKYRDRLDYAVIDAAYCQYILGVFRDGNTQLMVSEPSLSREESIPPAAEEPAADGEPSENLEEAPDQFVPDSTSSQDHILDTTGSVMSQPPSLIITPPAEKVTSEGVYRQISSVLERMNQLYGSVELMNEEFNEYLGAQAIQILSSTSVSSSVNLKLYMAVISVFFLIVGCGGAVLLGRAGDILEYLFLRDRLTGCMNRTSCDSYIDRWKDQPLGADMCCCNIQITNQQKMNEIYGRESVDQAMKDFGSILRELFEDRRNGFVGYNGSGQFWAFFEKEPRQTVKEEMKHMVLVLAQALSSIPLEYQIGFANAGELKQFWLRNLISEAVKDRSDRSASKKQKDGEE